MAIADHTGAILERYHYTSFGLQRVMHENFIEQSGEYPGYDWTALFHGHFLDKGRDIYCIGHRYYRPRLGRWLSQDPAGCVDGPNTYAYVNQNPWNRWDPTGLKTISDYQNMITAGTEEAYANLDTWKNPGKFAIWTELGRNEKIKTGNEGIAAIKAAALDIEYYSGIRVDPSMLNDESIYYKSFSRKLFLHRLNPEHKTVEAIYAGDLKEAAARVTISVGLGLVGSEVLSLVKIAPKIGGGSIYNVTDDFSKVVSSGRVWGQTEGSVYGMRIADAPKWRTMANNPVREPGTIIFEGQAASLFKPHPIEGLYSGMKRLLGQQKAGFGDIIFDTSTSTVIDKTIIIRNATIGTHAGQSYSQALSRLWGRRALDFGITTGVAGVGGGYIYLNIQED